jgi:excisionase family DNA binding protein
MVHEKLKPSEAASYLRIEKATLYRKVELGEIAHEKYLGRLYFEKKDLDAYIARNTKRVEV